MTHSDDSRPSTAGAAGPNHTMAPGGGDEPAAPPGRVLRIGTPEDLLAAVPVALGFVPEHSVVLLSLGPGRGPHARVDLLPGADAEQVDGVARTLLSVVEQHGVRRVALVVYGPLGVADETVALLVQRFTPRVEVVAVVAADGNRWRGWDGAAGVHSTGRAREYDARSHRFAAEAVLAGQVVHSSREELSASIEPSPLLCAEVERHRATLTSDVSPVQLEAWARRAAAPGRTVSARQVAQLRHGVVTPEGRDAAWGWVTRAESAAHVDLWRHVVRSCGHGEAAAEASVLAFHAWLAGDGALAWCALDRSCERGPSTSLGLLVAELLERAVSPRGWSPVGLAAQVCAEPPRPRTREPEGGRSRVVDLASRRGAPE